MSVQSVWGPETALQDKHNCKAPQASGPAWCFERFDTGENESPGIVEIFGLRNAYIS